MSTDTPGFWDDSARRRLREWDPDWAEAWSRIATNPWTSGVLPRKLVELIAIGLTAACTSMNADGTRRHIRAALSEGASREEIVLVLECAAVMSIHSCSLGAPILLQEAEMAGVHLVPEAGATTPACDQMKAAGQWNDAWDPFHELDPGWTDHVMAAGIGIYASGVLPAKDIELLSIALDASFTHMYAPGTRRHIRHALKAGATIEEVMEVLKLCVAHGTQACNLAVPLLDEELARAGQHQGPPTG